MNTLKNIFSKQLSCKNTGFTAEYDWGKSIEEKIKWHKGENGCKIQKYYVIL
jgi:hypothetical protein